MASQNRSSRSSRGTVLLITLGFLVAALVVGGVLWAKNNITWIKEQEGGGAWSLTYEARSVRGEERATAVRYRHSPGRYDAKQRDERLGSTTLPWNTEVVVKTGAKARVEVTPAGNGIASCRILLDGVRVVAQGTSPGPGKPAVCDVITSSTPEKWPR
ncbi:hypothetical protein HXP44_04350 [Streptomyces sioyaensis]|uniref:MmpS family membrane protein n=1 Tax=Streptomyces sioyaensis TaxID=67364 RepID=A0A4Q1R0K6_9ACTN|nr:hypothetical protein [Streptomyces sioyaensis]MBM4791313.1 hypothetical protein [Streptomyces sioyaensis]RXS65168.1 hypothetical protein EST54_19445 [Streptomyces sioyaensis]